MFSGLVSLSLLAASGPASAEYLSFRTDDIRSAMLGGTAPAADKADVARQIGPAGPRDDAYTALIAYADQINSAPAAGVGRKDQKAGAANRDDAYDALRDYARGLGAEQPSQRDNPQVQLAEADDLFSPLRRLFQTDEAQQSDQQSTEPSAFAQTKPKQSPAARAQAVIPVKTAAVDAHIVGSKVCQGCHTPHFAAFGETLMGKLQKQGKLQCETCHGPGSAHVKAGGGRGVGGIISFRLDDKSRTVEENNAICLGCHEKGDRILWKSSTHELRDVACANCHTVMRKVSPKFQLAKITEIDTCFQCHKNKRAEIWRSSHMPLREGKMTCTNCHNPHGSYNEALLKEATINDNCYKCHAEKRGPFLFEHPPVRENCANCHDPHGSINDFLLKISRPRLCQTCHANITGHPGNPRNPTSVYALNRECQNCHSQHHGSNSPSGSRWHR